VLKFVNSSYFGFAREISSVKLAITLVGIRTIKNFSLWSAVFSLMPNPKCGPFDLKSLWQDSLRRGLFARAFGKLLGMKEAEELFAGALLQDMAIPLLAKELPQRYLKLLEARTHGDSRLSDLERAEFGWTHADAAGFMARKWSLPEEFAQLIEAHIKLDEYLATGCKEPASCPLPCQPFCRRIRTSNGTTVSDSTRLSNARDGKGQTAGVLARSIRNSPTSPRCSSCRSPPSRWCSTGTTPW
jgi:hypothetical protein